MSELLSVIITAYNVEKYIAECLDSVISQSYSNIEIIVVDDGSKDQTGNICDQYSDRDERVKVIHKDNAGLVAARKTGIEASNGKYITFIDGDDWVDSDLYEKVVNNLSDADIYAYGLTCMYENGNEDYMLNSASSRLYKGEDLKNLKDRALYFSDELGQFGILPSLCSKVCKKSLIYNNLMSISDDIRLGEDAACSFPSIWDADKIIIDNSIRGYRYRQIESSTMSTSYSYAEFSRIENLFNVLYNAFSKRNADSMLKQLAYYLAFLFRKEMICELAYLRISNFHLKQKHLKEISGLKWVKYIAENCDYDKLDLNTRMLVKNIGNPLNLMIKWYSRRAFK